MTATCERCGRQFERAPGEDYKKLCKTCWCADKGNGAGDARLLANLQQRVGELEVQVTWLVYELMKRQPSLPCNHGSGDQEPRGHHDDQKTRVHANLG
jgi:hypothetical protein